VLDTAVLNSMDLPLPDPILLPVVQDEEYDENDEYQEYEEEDEDYMDTEQGDVEAVMGHLIEEYLDDD